jgi:dephospho-CoA kinase
LIVGLTGGLACGKSFVASALRDMGAYVVEADDLGRAVIAPGGEAVDAVLREFGTTDRQRLATRVFTDPPALVRLNAIIHPAVRARALREFASIHARDPHAIIIYVAAILFESGANRETSKVIMVNCTPAQQVERALERPGSTLKDVEARIARQMPVEQKAALADFIIDATGAKEETLRQTRIVFEELKKLASS